MKTRTLLLLSVGTALAILLAGGVLLFQLSNDETTIEPAALDEPVSIGDVDVTVFGAVETDDRFGIDVELGGVDDDLTGISLVTGDRRLDPLEGPDEGRCVRIELESTRCRLDFDVSAVESSSRALLIVRGDARRTWQLGA